MPLLLVAGEWAEGAGDGVGVDDAHELEGGLHGAEAGGVGASALRELRYPGGGDQQPLALGGGPGVARLPGLPAADGYGGDEVGDAGDGSVHPDRPGGGDAQGGADETEERGARLLAEDAELGEGLAGA